MKVESWVKKDSPTVKVEAVRLTEDNVSEVASWCSADIVEEIDPLHPEEIQEGLNVPAPDGTARASLGMYVIRFGRHFTVSYPRPFELMYEPERKDLPPNVYNPTPESVGDAKLARGIRDPYGSSGSVM